MKKICFAAAFAALFALFAAGCGENEGENQLEGSGKDGDLKTINGIECVLVKAGTFIMGSPISEEGRWDEETQHQVTLTKDFWISKYPITNAQYGKTVEGKSNHPVVNVDWTHADAWSKIKGGRLPTEAQWEFAARGGNLSNGYIYSGSNNLDNVGWYFENSDNETKSVGQNQPNELGIYDMSGNVWEWCSDWYDEYSTNAVMDPTGPTMGPNTGYYRVCRGGSWVDDAERCRVASRISFPGVVSTDYIGFRIAFDVE